MPLPYSYIPLFLTDFLSPFFFSPFQQLFLSPSTFICNSLSLVVPFISSFLSLFPSSQSTFPCDFPPLFLFPFAISFFTNTFTSFYTYLLLSSLLDLASLFLSIISSTTVHLNLLLSLPIPFSISYFYYYFYHHQHLSATSLPPSQHYFLYHSPPSPATSLPNSFLALFPIDKFSQRLIAVFSFPRLVSPLNQFTSSSFILFPLCLRFPSVIYFSRRVYYTLFPPHYCFCI